MKSRRELREDAEYWKLCYYRQKDRAVGLRVELENIKGVLEATQQVRDLLRTERQAARIELEQLRLERNDLLREREEILDRLAAMIHWTYNPGES